MLGLGRAACWFTLLVWPRRHVAAIAPRKSRHPCPAIRDSSKKIARLRSKSNFGKTCICCINSGSGTPIDDDGIAAEKGYSRRFMRFVLKADDHTLAHRWARAVLCIAAKWPAY
jgi:hypothetical protein